MRNMLLTETRHEEVGVVIPLLVPQRQPGQPRLLDRLLQVLGQQLALLVKVVARADVDEQFQVLALAPPFDQLGGVVLLPHLLGPVLAQVAGKGLLAPRAVDGVGDGREGRARLVQGRVLEVQGQRAVAAHRVARDGHAVLVQLVPEGAEQGRGQLLGEVRLHLVVLVKGGLGGVHVEAGRLAEIPAVLLAGQVEAARGGVGVQDGEAVLGGAGLEEALLGAVVGGAGQAGEPDEEGDLGGGGGGGQVEVEVHGGACCGGLVGEFEEGAAEGGDGGLGLKGRHFGVGGGGGGGEEMFG